MKKILIIGANGQVGFELRRYATEKNLNFVALDRNGLDLTDLTKIAATIQQISPDIIINAAAYTAVDKAEQESELAYCINKEAPTIIAETCALLNIPLLHISTDYVFPGDAKKPYVESDMTSPVGVYGASKLAGEQAIIENLTQYIILRTSWVFGCHGNNFVKTMLKLAKERTELCVVGDQIGCPTSAKDIALALLAMTERYFKEDSLPWGIYHYCGDEAVSWHQFAEKIIEVAKSKHTVQVEKVTPITTEEYPTLATRPQYSVLATQKIMQALAIAPSDWQAVLPQLIEEAKL